MTNPFPIPPEYREVSTADLAMIASDLPNVADRIGGPSSALHVTEVSDGNMNAVWRITGPEGSVIAKQALPYIRVIGQSWPFPVDRITYEHRALSVQARHVPQYLPRVYDYLPDLGLLFMQDLTPHVVLRHGLIAGTHYPKLASDLGEYLARSLFYTSDMHLGTVQKNMLADAFSGNAHLCETTQDVVFTGPYWDAPLNRITQGQQARADALRADVPLKLAIAELKHIFCTSAEALIHGDLHTGSVMVTAEDTRVIDPEWSFIGPMGFDIGALLGNLLLGYFSQKGHANGADDRDAQRQFLLDTIVGVWTAFDTGFRQLCRTKSGPLLHQKVLSETDQGAFVDRRLAAIFSDTLGFAGAKMIRRIIGISHVEDFEMITDIPLRATCEAGALDLARQLVLDRTRLAGPQDVVSLARQIDGTYPARNRP